MPAQATMFPATPAIQVSPTGLTIYLGSLPVDWVRKGPHMMMNQLENAGIVSAALAKLRSYGWVNEAQAVPGFNTIMLRVDAKAAMQGGSSKQDGVGPRRIIENGIRAAFGLPPVQSPVAAVKVVDRPRAESAASAA